MSIVSERLYYEDSYLISFEGIVVNQRYVEDHWHIQLQSTAFYPTSGGQPHDTGSIGSYHVIDVYIDEEQHVLHVLDGSLSDAEQPPFDHQQQVHCEVDWARRFDHMQHHTGQHILSACFEQEFNIDTIGFHLGPEDVTVDLDASDLALDTIRHIESVANSLIWSNVAIQARFIDADELALLHLRRPPKVTENIRIVSIGEFDKNACGGTHVLKSGEVGLLKVIKSERVRQGTRLHFRCGQRALRDYQERNNMLTETANYLSVGISDVPQAVVRLDATLKQTRKAEEQCRSKLNTLRASHYATMAQRSQSGEFTVCAHVNDIENPGELKPLATSVIQALPAETSEAIVSFVSSEHNRMHLIVLASEGAHVAANNIVRTALAEVGGRGGGNERVAQGSAPMSEQGSPERLLKIVEEMLSTS